MRATTIQKRTVIAYVVEGDLDTRVITVGRPPRWAELELGLNDQHVDPDAAS